MSVPIFRTWLVIERPDQTLENILKALNCYAKVDLAERPRLSLEWRNGAVLLRTNEPEVLFRRVFADRPKPVRAVSIAPHNQIRLFAGKVFQYKGSRYRLRSVPPTDSPYYRRFIEIEFLEPGIQPDSNEAQTVIEVEQADAISQNSLLWIDPQLIELEDRQVSYLFDFTPTKRCLTSDVTGAFFLPPIRSRKHPDLVRLPDLDEQDSRDGSYFSSDLVRLREELHKWEETGVRNPDQATAVRIWQVLNEPLLRDLLLDGGGIRVTNEEGRPTSLILNLHEGHPPGARYRARAILDPGGVDGPVWSHALLKTIREDIEGLVPEGWQIERSGASPDDAVQQEDETVRPSKRDWDEPVNWRIHPFRPYRPGGYDGTWYQFRKLREKIAGSPEASHTLEERVLLPTRERADADSPPDNDLAEQLFVHYAWRCPWSGQPDEISWRYAMLEILRDELLGHSPMAEFRVDRWNEHSDSDAGTKFKFVHSRRDSDRAFLLRYSGAPDDDYVLKWRLLLPLGTVINARTLFLDCGARSHLDREFVLA